MLSSFREPEDFRSADGNNDIEPNERNEDPKIAPPIPERDVDRRVEIFPFGELAVLAMYSRIQVVEVPSSLLHKCRSILFARLATWWIEHVELARGTLNFKIVHLSDNKTRDQPSEGVQLVHPRPPELGHIRLRNSDTAE